MKTGVDESTQNELSDNLSRTLADQIGSRIAKDLEEACLAEETIRVADLFDQGTIWINDGGIHASPTVRRN